MSNISSAIIKHSIGSGIHHIKDGVVTFILKYPRFIHSEFMTHCCFARNAASSRAIPIEKMISAVKESPATFEFWGKNQKGMQAMEELTGFDLEDAKHLWESASDCAILKARSLSAAGCHKQMVNRVIEPWAHITVIATTGVAGLLNFFALRAHADAQPEFQVLAYMMLSQFLKSTPQALNDGEWHIPFDPALDDFNMTIPFSLQERLKIATGRIARVSYLTHDGKRDPKEDQILHDRLASSGHWSPFEHCARYFAPKVTDMPQGKFGPRWVQYRKDFEGEMQEPSLNSLKLRLSAMPEWARQAIERNSQSTEA